MRNLLGDLRPCAGAFFIVILLGCGAAHPSVANPTLLREVVTQMTAEATARAQKPDSGQLPESPASKFDSQVQQVNGAETRASIRATVNNIPILDEEIREASYFQLRRAAELPEPQRSARVKEIYEKTVQHLVERELVLQDAFTRLKGRQQLLDKLNDLAKKESDKRIRTMKKDLGEQIQNMSDQEFQTVLRLQGLTLAGLKRQIEREFMATEYMRGRIFPAVDRISPRDVREYYDTHPEEFQTADAVKWLDIFVDASKFATRTEARRFAEGLAQQARSGADFQKLSLQYDQGDSSYRKGYGYGTKRGEIRPREVEATLFQLKDGDIGPVVELGNGYHVFKLEKRDYAGQLPFDEKTQGNIRNKLQNQIWELEYKRIMVDLKRKAAIEHIP